MSKQAKSKHWRKLLKTNYVKRSLENGIHTSKLHKLYIRFNDILISQWKSSFLLAVIKILFDSFKLTDPCSSVFTQSPIYKSSQTCMLRTLYLKTQSQYPDEGHFGWPKRWSNKFSTRPRCRRYCYTFTPLSLLEYLLLVKSGEIVCDCSCSLPAI